MKRYCCGFAMDPTKSNVLLIKKKIPLWQEGKLNGIGGTIEKGKVEKEEMVREFYEETSLVTDSNSWRSFLRISDINGAATVVFYYIIFDFAGVGSVETHEGTVKIYNVNSVISMKPEKLVRNLKWLLLIVLDDSVNEILINHLYFDREVVIGRGSSGLSKRR